MDLPTPDFSDIPALGDTDGLSNFMNAQALNDAGISTAPAAQTTTSATEPTPTEATQTEPNNTTPAQPTITNEQINQILQNNAALQQQVALMQQQQQAAAQSQAQPQQTGYTPTQIQAITNALNRGMSLEEILARISGNSHSADSKRIDAIEQQMRAQEYIKARDSFIDRLTNFGEQYGLSEQDLVLFGQTAYQQGINIANENVNLTTAFRAIFPEQYAIRTKRMQNTSTSQIYGGTNVSEDSNVNASKMADAYTEQFLKSTMPNYFK